MFRRFLNDQKAAEKVAGGFNALTMSYATNFVEGFSEATRSRA